MGVVKKRGGDSGTSLALACHCPLPITSFVPLYNIPYTCLSCRVKMGTEKEAGKQEKSARKGHPTNPAQRKCPHCQQFMKLKDLHTMCHECRIKIGMNGTCDGVTEVCTECADWTQAQKDDFALSIAQREAKAKQKKSPESPTLWNCAEQLGRENAPTRTKAAVKQLPAALDQDNDDVYSLGPATAGVALSSDASASLQAKMKPVAESSSAIRNLKDFPMPTNGAVPGQMQGQFQAGNPLQQGLWPAHGSVWRNPAGQFYQYDQTMMPPPPQVDHTAAMMQMQIQMAQSVTKLVNDLPRMLQDTRRSAPTAAAGAPPPQPVYTIYDSDEDPPRVTIKKEPLDTGRRDNRPPARPLYQRPQEESESSEEGDSGSETLRARRLPFTPRRNSGGPTRNS